MFQHHSFAGDQRKTGDSRRKYVWNGNSQWSVDVVFNCSKCAHALISTHICACSHFRATYSHTPHVYLRNLSHPPRCSGTMGTLLAGTWLAASGMYVYVSSQIFMQILLQRTCATSIRLLRISFCTNVRAFCASHSAHPFPLFEEVRAICVNVLSFMPRMYACVCYGHVCLSRGEPFKSHLHCQGMDVYILYTRSFVWKGWDNLHPQHQRLAHTQKLACLVLFWLHYDEVSVSFIWV